MRVGSARDADHKKTRGFSFQRQCLLVLSGQKQPGTITVVFVGGMNSGKVFPEKNSPKLAGTWLVQTEGSIHSSKGTLIHFSSKAVFSCKTQEVFYFLLLE